MKKITPEILYWFGPPVLRPVPKLLFEISLINNPRFAWRNRLVTIEIFHQECALINTDIDNTYKSSYNLHWICIDMNMCVLWKYGRKLNQS